VEWLGSGNLAMPRSVFQAMGGFDTSLEACEDVDLCNRIRTAGYRIVADPRIASVHHGDPRTLGELFRSERWRGRNNLRVSFRRPFNWGSIPSAMLPIIDLVVLGLVALGVGGRLAGWERGTQVAMGAVIVIAVGALLRVARATTRGPRDRPASFIHTFAVAAVYDLARACALITRAPHRNAESRAAVRTTSS
jgi:GT2 family glycosyltransferase